MKYENPDIESSYKQNDLGRTLYEYVLDMKPRKIVEFGVLNGYSTVAMAMALDELGAGTIDAYDLWTKYPYKNAKMSNTALNITKYGLGKYVNLLAGDFWDHEPEYADLYVLDLSNDGEILKKAYDKLKGKGKILLFEGGSPERDRVSWMKEYDKKPMTGSDVPYSVLDYRFPSISTVKL